ncbi:hypothetical protein F53441_3870 [Fusarium austroafricanum]|uniref:Uncharacterized protein n=1 Tax=Fusarium austroafricanum TaxID=2364996 RepID=A0A8H4KNR8_9HYPO|nr:hypothetical protein F53441_3870 [Fusarium austroafricanum]
MCQKIITRCCHCGELLDPYFMACNSWRVHARIAAREDETLPSALECEYFTRETRPMLLGCPNNDTCPSWFGNMFWGYGDAENDGLEIKSMRERVAFEKFKEWEAEFARKYFTKKPIPPIDEPVGFWFMASRDFFTDVGSSHYASTEISEIDLGNQDNAFERGGCRNIFEKSDETYNENCIENSIDESSRLDPEELFYGDVTKNSFYRTETKSTGGKLIAGEGQALVTPIWNWFLSIMDTGRDGEFTD